MPNVKEFSSKVIKLVGRYKYVFLVIVAGILLLLWPSGAPDTGGDTQETLPGTAGFSVSELEAKLEEVLSSAKHVGKTSVVLTLKTDVEVLLSKDERVSQHREMEGGQLTAYDYETDVKTVMGAGGAGNNPVIVGRVYPEFKGALVVCEGADNQEVQLSVVEAVSSLTGLGADKITVVAMRQS